MTNDALTITRSLFAASLVYLSGCASTAQITAETAAVVSAQWRGLDAAQACCTEYRDLAYMAMPEGGLRFSVEAGEARNFAQHKSYFRGVNLPPSSKTSRWLVKAHLMDHRKHGLSYLLRPSLAVLDAKFQEIGTQVDLPLCYNQGWSQPETGYFSILQIDPAVAARLVFFTAQSSRNQSIPFGNEATTAGGGAIVTVNVNYQFPYAPVGDLEILPLSEKMAQRLQERCPSLFPSS